MDAYCTYGRPILEYVAFFWSPYTNININKLESVQRRAARYVMSDFNRYSSVSEMLSTLQWGSLKKRRDIQSPLCVLYKILNGLIDVSLPGCMINNSLITRGHNKRFVTISSTVIIATSSAFFHDSGMLYQVILSMHQLHNNSLHLSTSNLFNYLIN